MTLALHWTLAICGCTVLGAYRFSQSLLMAILGMAFFHSQSTLEETEVQSMLRLWASSVRAWTWILATSFQSSKLNADCRADILCWSQCGEFAVLGLFQVWNREDVRENRVEEPLESQI